MSYRSCGRHYIAYHLTQYCWKPITVLQGNNFFYKSVEPFSLIIVRGPIDQKFQLKDWTLQLANINPKCPYTTDIVPRDNHQFRCLYKHLLRPLFSISFHLFIYITFLHTKSLFAKTYKQKDVIRKDGSYVNI